MEAAGVGDGAGLPFHEGESSWCSEGNQLALVGAQRSFLQQVGVEALGKGTSQGMAVPSTPLPGALGGQTQSPRTAF